ncbi:MAG: hypothetical protein RL030_2803 [Pseudomonadota bacterium]|jgi:hypothetical protein
MTPDGLRQIIWPLRGKIFQPVFLQTRPRWTGWRGIVPSPVLPWNAAQRPPAINYGSVGKPPNADSIVPIDFGLCALGVRAGVRAGEKGRLAGTPSVIHALKPMPAKQWVITGITKDSAGAVLASCVVQLFRTVDDKIMDEITSSAAGVFEFRSASNPSNTHYIVAYKAGSPDVAGTTVNTLVPV